jgi:hypothetical protein
MAKVTHLHKKSKSRSRSKQHGGAHHATSSGSIYPASHTGTSNNSENTMLIGSIIGVIVVVLLGIIIYLIYQSFRSNQANASIALPGGESGSINISTSTPVKNGMGNTINAGSVSSPYSLAHPELAGHRIVSRDADNPRELSYWDYLNIKDHERIVNPLLPPERSYENTYGIPINVPSRGFSGGFQQVGTLYKNEVMDAGKVIGNSPETVIIPIFGRPIYPGGNKWNYYVTSDKYAMVKMPFMYQGRKSDDQYGVNEIMDGDIINLPEYNGEFVVKIYQYDKPRYIPFIY